ncbi:MAG: protein-glutamate O-methyltransferase family protein [Anaerolineae bacterium]|nr:protein-glutamate O-methyltransferase family protein [Anaerolineae bacterium]
MPSRPHLPKPLIDLATVPPLLSTGDPNSFAHNTLKVRDPNILQGLIDAPYFSPDLKRAFKKFHAELLAGTIEPLRENTPDHDFWRDASKPYIGRSWLDVPWYWAETFFYRRILEIVGYFQLGAWHEKDPFFHDKQAELVPTAAPARVATVLESTISNQRAAISNLLHAALWGNRVDLSYNVEQTVGRAARPEDEHANLLVDDAPRVLAFLTARPLDQLAYVADNAGTELALDLALIDQCLTSDLVKKITLHLKPQPFYVSDAMPQDVEHTLRAFENANADTRGVAQRLRAHLKNNRLELRVHWFYPTSLHYFEMPDDLYKLFQTADFSILKGDVNYRRLVGDAHWKPTIAFDYTTRYFPTPFVALRTMKSELVVGLEATQVQHLDQLDPHWRTNGKRGVIQANLSIAHS